MGIFGSTPDLAEIVDHAVARAIKSIREERCPWHTRILHTVGDSGRIEEYGNFVSLDLVNHSPGESFHPDAFVVAIGHADRSPSGPLELLGEDEYFLRPGDTIPLPYESFRYRWVDTLAEVPASIAVDVRPRLTFGWIWGRPALPSAQMAQRPIAQRLSVAGTGLTASGTVGTSSTSLAPQPCAFVVLQNREASGGNTLYYAVGLPATTGHQALAPGESILLPASNVEQVNVLGSAAATAFAYTYFREV